ncbi:hypothetical protein F4561_003394 [Lipingzhangella halophila]|uniref:Uncharacterized protein n=1 Tax=Lipingzhangella halophila TaxID=1783352 RepID=A0A7W7RII7_9ACTN|nr:STM3941 family protein [Lipingzhangella halophila]MBB4932574.1 hypothetical protein [Lipingzhangella halophila]
MGNKAKLIVAFGVMILMSGFLALTGEVFGYIGLLFFGGSGAVLLVLNRRPRRVPGAGGESGWAGTVHGTLPGAHRYTARTAGLVFPGRRGAALAVAIGAALFVLLGAWMVFAGLYQPNPSERIPSPALVVIGAVSIGFFGLCGVLGARSLFGRARGVALLPEGVYLRAPAGRAWVRWDDLAQAYVGTVSGQSHIALLAHAPELIELTGLNRWLHGTNRRNFGMDVGYPGQHLHVSPEEVVSAITHYRASPPAREQLPDPQR